MRNLFIWIVEFSRLIGGRRLYPLTTQCPICQQMVRLHVNKAGRRHVYGHARALYEGSRFSVHYVTNGKCAGSGSPKEFNPRPNEHQQFKLPSFPLEE